MSKLAVIFPGVGYHADKPLLYYAAKLAKAQGYEVKVISYGNFPPDIKGDKQKMEEAFQSALSQTEEQLSQTDFTKYTKVLFLSKSIGTAVAAAYEGRHQIPANNIFFTPVEETFLFVKQRGIVFHGTADPWAKTAIVKQCCAKLGLPLYITEQGNHSLECADVDTDLANLRQIMRQCESYLLHIEE